MMNIISYIPSPPFDAFGPVRIYGITMGIAIAVGIFIAHKRYSSSHDGSAIMLDLFLPVVIAGLVGARVYHLFTGYDWDTYGFAGTINFRNGGLSIWGAVAFGAIALFIIAKYKKQSFIELAAAAVPGLLVAQAIGRLGNYFNQELYGKPLDAPWALKVDVEHRIESMQHVATYHATFLYEMLWCLALAGIIVICEKKVLTWNNKMTVASYIAGYCLGRIIFESLRIDKASKLFGVRFNLLLTSTLFIVGLFWLLYLIVANHKASTSEPTR